MPEGDESPKAQSPKSQEPAEEEAHGEEGSAGGRSPKGGKRSEKSKYKLVQEDDDVPANEVRVGRGGAKDAQAAVEAASALFDKEGDDAVSEIVFRARGPAINFAVVATEVLKRRIAGLHQITTLEIKEVTDKYVPRDEDSGLEPYEKTRKLKGLVIKLSKAALDSAVTGYQPPLDEGDVSEGGGEFLLEAEKKQREKSKSSGRGGGGDSGRGSGRGKGGKGKKGKGRWDDDDDWDMPPRKGGKGKGSYYDSPPRRDYDDYGYSKGGKGGPPGYRSPPRRRYSDDDDFRGPPRGGGGPPRRPIYDDYDDQGRGPPPRRPPGRYDDDRDDGPRGPPPRGPPPGGRYGDGKGKGGGYDDRDDFRGPPRGPPPRGPPPGGKGGYRSPPRRRFDDDY